MKGCRALKEHEVQEVAKALFRTRDKALFVLGVRTGLRISELLSLKVGDVWQHGRVVDLVYIARRHLKKKVEGRAIPLHREAKEALQALVQELQAQGRAAANAPLFQSRKGGRAITRQQAHRVLKEAYEACELTGKVATHSLRKTFAQAVYRKVGGDLVKTQKALGHKNINSTLSYLSCQEEEVFEAILAL